MKERHITKVARTLIARYKIGPEAVIDPRDPSGPSCPYLWSQIDIVVMKQLHSMKPETLGRITAQGLSFVEADRQNKTSMFLAGTVLEATNHRMLSGKRQLVHLAATTLLAEMFDILREQIELSATELKSFRKLEPFMLKKSW